MSVPARKTSAVLPPTADFLSYTAKMVPVETLQSMLEDPSRGSNATQYLPATPRCQGKVCLCVSYSKICHTPLYYALECTRHTPNHVFFSLQQANDAAVKIYVSNTTKNRLLARAIDCAVTFWTPFPPMLPFTTVVLVPSDLPDKIE